MGKATKWRIVEEKIGKNEATNGRSWRKFSEKDTWSSSSPQSNAQMQQELATYGSGDDTKLSDKKKLQWVHYIYGLELEWYLVASANITQLSCFW